MPQPIDRALRFLGSLRSPQLDNLFAQVNAKQVLEEVREEPRNLPAFDVDLDDRVTYAAYGFLAAGCSLIEQERRSEGAAALEQGAALLIASHGSSASMSRESGFHKLIAAMAFYAAGHYSRAFVAVNEVSTQTDAAAVIALFLRKDFILLVPRLGDIILSEERPAEDTLEDRIITETIARAVAQCLEFIVDGRRETTLDAAREELRQAMIIAAEARHPSWWWVLRLLLLMFEDLARASPWSFLPPFFDPDDPVLKSFIAVLAFSRRPVSELWISQRQALPHVLDQSKPGCVVNLRTSAGKTRVAEIAILHTLVREPTARILYLAPFRSLALEVEQALAASLGYLGFSVSHLYGGARVSSIDTELVADSTITIATPEKARALLRAAPELFASLRLIVVDEGHLLGPNERLIRNEVFLDHLRILSAKTGARLLLLSAVLPNPQDLAEWVTGSGDNVVVSTWKPSGERFGLLRWKGDRVRIDWIGSFASFNPSFVVSGPLGFGRRRKPFPYDKNEAIAATAVRLSALGPVMIFSARAKSVPSLAKAVLLSLGESPPDHPWPEREWAFFEAVCREELDANAIEFIAARAGVICHSNHLTPQVRFAIEHLMRALPPRIIIATTTLAQGVNIGVSSVIIATPYIDQNRIEKRDFWNICGRAGRAFIDGEGKVLYAIDHTRTRSDIRRDERLAREYFQGMMGDPAVSGLLIILIKLRKLAAQAGVDFEMLLELAANNSWESVGEASTAWEEFCDLLDDHLLALHTDPIVNPNNEEPAQWIETVFRGSLAAIQARARDNAVMPMSAEELLRFLRARAEGVLQRVENGGTRRAVVRGGLPLRVALRISLTLDELRNISDTLTANGLSAESISTAVRALEEWVAQNAVPVAHNMPTIQARDAIRAGWLSGLSLNELAQAEPRAKEICRDFYGYQLPWVVHAIGKQFRSDEDADRADAFDKVALLVELGVPSVRAAQVFLSGVRSRAAAAELAVLDGTVSFVDCASVSQIVAKLRDVSFRESLRLSLSESTAQWLDLVDIRWRGPHIRLPVFRRFSITGIPSSVQVLHARTRGDRVFLSTADGRTRVDVTEEVRPFRDVANDLRFIFKKVGSQWGLASRDPRVS